FVSVFQTFRRGRNDAFTAVEPAYQRSSAALREDLHIPLHDLPFKSNEHELLAIYVAQSSGRHIRSRGSWACARVLFRNEMDRRVHFRAEMQVWVQDLNLHFDGCLF